jgi:hypothetical protein
MEFPYSSNLIKEETVFPHKICHKVPWVPPDNITENQIDHKTISKRFRRYLLDVRNKRGADIGSEHHLVVADFRLKILATRKFETRRKKYNVQKLKTPIVMDEFKLELKNRFIQNEATDIEATWRAIKNVYTENKRENTGI